MPQASEEQRKEWGGAQGVGEDKAIKFLEAAGYKLTPGWCWIKPTPEHELTEQEYGAMRFLIDEWDFGGTLTQEEADAEDRKRERLAKEQPKSIPSSDSDFSSPWG